MARFFTLVTITGRQRNFNFQTRFISVGRIVEKCSP
uniref:Uncharacterized protein n=1 Tax=Romanomermis culicivorax TaxID=13658 RepID=A0A915I355_ROMCU